MKENVQSLSTIMISGFIRQDTWRQGSAGGIDDNGQCVDFKCGVRPVLWRRMN